MLSGAVVVRKASDAGAPPSDSIITPSRLEERVPLKWIASAAIQSSVGVVSSAPSGTC